MRRHEDPDGSIYSGVHGAYGKLMSLVAFRFYFRNELPYMLWEGRSREAGIALRSKYVADTEAGWMADRVSRRWFLVEESELAFQYSA